MGRTDSPSRVSDCRRLIASSDSLDQNAIRVPPRRFQLPETCRLAVPPSRPLPSRESIAESPPSNWKLIGRMLALGWRYRLGCIQGVLLQMLRVGFSLGSLGLVGLGIDVLRHQVDPEAAAPRWPLGLIPPADWSPMFLLMGVAASILCLSLCHGLLRYASEITAARLVERIVVQLRSDVYAKLQRLSFRFFDANETGSIINRVAGTCSRSGCSSMGS